jgi:hypothetical protein
MLNRDIVDSPIQRGTLSGDTMRQRISIEPIPDHNSAAKFKTHLFNVSTYAYFLAFTSLTNL